MTRIGYLVDVQNDFMRPAAPGGRLYVRHLHDPADAGAEQIIPALVALHEWMRAACHVTCFSGDWHAATDAEIAIEGADFRTTYPPHCMGRSEDPAERQGAHLIAELPAADAMPHLPLDILPHQAHILGAAVARNPHPVFIPKTQFSVWTGNAGMAHFLEGLTGQLPGPIEIVVGGVASDVCVDAAIRGFRTRGYAVLVVAEAIYSLGSRPDAELHAEWEQLGARITSLAELEADRSHSARSPEQTSSTETPRRMEQWAVEQDLEGLDRDVPPDRPDAPRRCTVCGAPGAPYPDPDDPTWAPVRCAQHAPEQDTT